MVGDCRQYEQTGPPGPFSPVDSSIMFRSGLAKVSTEGTSGFAYAHFLKNPMVSVGMRFIPVAHSTNIPRAYSVEVIGPAQVWRSLHRYLQNENTPTATSLVIVNENRLIFD